jgi:hypothetical protein
MALILGVVLVATFVGVPKINGIVHRSSSVSGPPPLVRVEAMHVLPGAPMALVFRGRDDGYMSLGEGEILHFTLPERVDGELHLEIVAKGLVNPRGVAIIGDRLFVSELGPLHCDPALPECAAGASKKGELKILKSSSGRILSFDIAANGDLSNRRTIVADLPVVNSYHGNNGLVAGPDGFLYASIGGVDALWTDPSVTTRLHRPNLQLLGTIIRFDPNGRSLEVFARGIRNVYDMTFEGNHLFAADNDGPTIHGWRKEEVYQVQKGANYGYPYDGTFGPYTVRTAPPLWVLDPGSVGSAGIEWGGRLGLGPGLLIGDCSKLEFLKLTNYAGTWLVRDRSDYLPDILSIPGCATSIDQGPGGQILVSIVPYQPSGEGSLYVLAANRNGDGENPTTPGD